MAALARALSVPESLLHELSATADSRYRLASAVEKPDGSIRQTFDALPPLKDIHRRIKAQIFSHVEFPEYLTGSVKGQDYKTNAALHVGARIVICEDISNFFPTTTLSIIFHIWRHFFGFADDVAECLTKLTSKDGVLPQGQFQAPSLRISHSGEMNHAYRLTSLAKGLPIPGLSMISPFLRRAS